MYVPSHAEPVRPAGALHVARLLITGANGHLGRRLISALPHDDEIEALVRSERARQTLISH